MSKHEHRKIDDSSLLASGSCPSCYCGIHSDCYNWDIEGNTCCCPKKEVTPHDAEEGQDEATTIDRIKAASAITDVTSTGRKRAALAYPIHEGMICEWSELKNAGGGVRPIIGCAGNLATDRHHGPDKNTLNNTEGNVHRICANCHNRWHTANDEFYGTRPPGTEPFIPLDGHSWSSHDPNTKATSDEIIANEISWRTRKKAKKA